MELPLTFCEKRYDPSSGQFKSTFHMFCFLDIDYNL